VSAGGTSADLPAENGRHEEAAAQATDPSGTTASATSSAGDSEHDTDDVDADSDETVIAVAEAVKKGAAVITANAELRESSISDDAAAKADASDSTANGGTSDGGAATKRVPAELESAEARLENATVTTPEMLKVATSPGETVDETAPSKADRKLRTAKSRSATETERKDQGEGRLGDQVAGPQPSDEADASRAAAKVDAEAAGLDPALNETTPADRDAGSENSRDANAHSSARQRSDAADLANKVAVAAAANGAATQQESSASSGDAVDGAARVGKSAAAKVDALGNGANRLHANAGPSKRGSRTNGAEEVSRIDPARFVGRVAKAFHTAQERGGTLQIRLSPPELGAMRLELTVKDGVMTAALETETSSARRVLLENLPALRDRLAEQNIRVERFDVEVRREGTGGQADPRAAQDQQQPQQGHSEHRRRQAAQPPIAETARQIKPINPAQTNNNGINLVA
jgi:flagellar hook-length control protein FliK